jgi:hypothetical protein
MAFSLEIPNKLFNNSAIRSARDYVMNSNHVDSYIKALELCLKVDSISYKTFIHWVMDVYAYSIDSIDEDDTIEMFQLTCPKEVSSPKDNLMKQLNDIKTIATTHVSLTRGIVA